MNGSDTPNKTQTNALHLNPSWTTVSEPKPCNYSSLAVLWQLSNGFRTGTPANTCRPPGRARTACLLYFGHYSICSCCAYILSRPRVPLAHSTASATTTTAHKCRRCDMHTNALSLVNKYGMKNEWRCISLQVTLGVQVTRRQEKCAVVGDKSVWITKVHLA